MTSILNIGDIHNKTTQPYYSLNREFFEWLVKNHKNDIPVFSGDFWDTSNPHSEDLVDIFLDYLLQFPEVHIVTGNHEIGARNGNPLVPLRRIPNIHIYTEPTETTILGVKYLMLPFLYNVKEMKEKYEALTNQVDYVMSHVAYPGTNFGAPDEINLSGIQAKAFFYGHIHEPMDFGNHHILGVPNTTRYGEQDWKKRMAIVNPENSYRFVSLEDFVKFEDVEFGKDPINPKAILNVKKAPSVKAVMIKYKGFHLRLQGIELEGGSTSAITYEDQKGLMNFSLENNFNEFYISLGEKPREPVVDKIKELFTLVP